MAFDTSIVGKLFSVGATALTKITDTVFVKRAKMKLRSLIGYPMYTKWIQGTQPAADTISAITAGTQTLITMSASHFRRDGDYVTLDGLVDDGLWILNGRHQITYQSDTAFYVDVDTTDADTYTSGGSVIDAIWADLDYALAYLIMYFALPQLIDVKDGDFGVILIVYQQYGDGKADPPDTLDMIKELQQIFLDNAQEIANENIEAGGNFDTQIIEV
jgi:hypothetical protein